MQQHPTSKIGRAYELLNELRPRATDDSAINVRQIMRLMETQYGAALEAALRQGYQEGLPLDERLVQTFGELPLVDDEDDFEREDTRRTLRRCRVELPLLAAFGPGPATSYVGGSGFDAPFTRAASSSAAHRAVRGSHLLPARPVWWLSGPGRAYVLLPAAYRTMETLTLHGVPQRPEGLIKPEDYDLWAEDWPIPPHLWPDVKRRVMEQDFGILAQTMQSIDTKNDGKDN